MQDKELEELEKLYFDKIFDHLRKNINAIIKGLASRHKIFNDWNTQFVNTAREGYDASNLDIGAERVLHRVFSTLNWEVSSVPVVADLMFETDDAFIHIDVKTALLTNPADHNGKLNIGRNQTSYPAHKGTYIVFKPNLLEYYSNGKVCLTYAIHTIHENNKKNIIAILLISIPNGQLFGVYGNNIVNRGKSAFYPPGTNNVNDFRYAYHKIPVFSKLGKGMKKPFRVRFVHFDNSQNKGVTKSTIVRNPMII